MRAFPQPYYDRQIHDQQVSAQALIWRDEVGGKNWKIEEMKTINGGQEETNMKWMYNLKIFSHGFLKT